MFELNLFAPTFLPAYNRISYMCALVKYELAEKLTQALEQLFKDNEIEISQFYAGGSCSISAKDIAITMVFGKDEERRVFGFNTGCSTSHLPRNYDINNIIVQIFVELLFRHISYDRLSESDLPLRVYSRKFSHIEDIADLVAVFHNEKFCDLAEAS